MPQLMRCQFCGTLQDEPGGAKVCIQCGGELVYEAGPLPNERDSYVKVQLELDQVMAPAGQAFERHLLILLQTPAIIPPSQAAPAAVGRPPLNFTAVLDVSGSMSGEKLVQAKSALRQALDRLNDGDILSLVVFSTDARCVLEPTQLTSHTRKVVVSALQEITTHESTNLCGGLVLGLEKALSGKGKSNLMLLLSDGLANEGETDLDKIGHHAHIARDKGITVSTIGVGDDYNEALMVEIANQGGGRFYHVEKPAEISAYLTGELGEIVNLAARDARIQLTVPSGAILLPPSTVYPIEQKPNLATVMVGVIPSDTELEIPIGMILSAQTEGSRLSIEGALTYESLAGNSLKSSLNRVTIRVVEPALFQTRSGVITPVVEKVLTQLKAEHVLSASRMMRQRPADAAKQMSTELAKLRAYASLLGDERADKESNELAAIFVEMNTSSQMLKSQVSAAHYTTRSSKKFRGGGKSP